MEQIGISGSLQVFCIQDAIFVSLDNMDETMLYDMAGNLVSGMATCAATLMNGSVDVSDQATAWQVTAEGCTLASASNSRNIIVSGMTATTGRVTVTATYLDKQWTQVMTLRKQVGKDKYDLLIRPNIIAYNAVTPVTQTLSIEIWRTDLTGARTKLETINAANGSIYLAVRYGGSWRTQSSFSLSVTPEMAVANDQIEIEVRRVNAGATYNVSDSTTYKVEDSQAVPVATGVNSYMVALYKRGATAGSGPSGTVYYKFGDGKLYTSAAATTEATTALNGWSLSVPATDGNPCWRIQAQAIGTDATDGIAPAEWSSAEKFVEDGESSLSIDLDNGADQFGTDSESAVLVQQVRTTKASMFLGHSADPESLTALTAALYYEDGTSVPSGVASVSADATTGIVTVTIKTGTFSHESMYAEITATCAKGSRTARFTLSKVKSGAPGVSPTLYQLKPSMSSIAFGRDSSDNLTPDWRTLSLDIVKYDGATSTNVLPSSLPSGYAIRYDWTSMPSGKTAGTAWPSGNSLTVDNSREYVYIAMFSGEILIDQETIPVVKDGLKGPSGDSTLAIDLDNMADQFGTDSDSVVLAQQVRTTKASMFLGYSSTPETLTALSAVLYYEDGTSVPSGVASVSADTTTGIVTVTVKTGTFSHESMYAEITGTCASGSRTARFTLSKVKSGAPGVSPTLYQLKPSMSSIAFNRDSSDNLTPASRTLSLAIVKYDGATSTNVLPSYLPSGYAIRYSWTSMPASSSDGTAWPSGNSLTVANTREYVYIAMFSGEILIDQETIPVVKDGLKGPAGDNAIRIDLTNQTDLLSCNSQGYVLAARTISTRVRIFEGGSIVTSGVTKSASMRAEDLTIGDCEPTISDVVNGVVTITWQFTTSNYADTTSLLLELVYDGYTYGAEFSLSTVETSQIWQVIPSPSEASFTKNSSNVLTPSSIRLYCGYNLMDGSNSESVEQASVTDGQIGSTGVYIYYRSKTNDTWSGWSTYITSGILVSSSTSVQDYEFCLSTALSASSVSGSNILDRECIPVVKDGLQGPAGDDAVIYELKASPSAINFRTNAAGEIPSSSVEVICRVYKTVGNSESTLVTPMSNDSIDDLYRLFYYDQYHGVWELALSNSDYVGMTVLSSQASAGYITSVPFVLTTAGSGSQITEANTVKRIDVPVILDGRKGSTGAKGDTYFPMGEYSGNVEYTKTETRTPIVLLDDGTWNSVLECRGHYWELTAASNWPGGTAASAQAPCEGSEYWSMVDDSYGVVIMRGLFAKFAKLASAIVSGDFLYSANGRIGDTEYQSGQTVDGRPAYSYFNGDPDAQTGTVSRTNLTGPVNSDRATIATLEMIKGMTIAITITGATTGSFYYFAVYKGTTRVSSSVYLSSTSSTKTISYAATADGEYTIECYGTSSTTVVSFSLAWAMADFFNPNMYFDLLTGKISGARGNFKVLPDGQINIGKGNLVATANGDLTVKGTIKAQNLYRNVCLFAEGGIYDREVYYIASLNDWSTEKGYQVGDYIVGRPDPNEEPDFDDTGMILCSYDADYIRMVPTTGNWADDTPVYLPDPKDFPGKVVEIQPFAYGTASAACYVECVAERNGGLLSNGVVYNGSSFTIANRTTSITIRTGVSALFHSMLIDGEYFWVSKLV